MSGACGPQSPVRRARHARWFVLVELCAVALVLAALASGTLLRSTLICVAAVCAGTASGRLRHRFVSTWFSTAAGRSLQRGRASRTLVANGIVVDVDGAVGVFELGDSTMLVTAAETPLPRLDQWRSLSQSGGPHVHPQVLVLTSPTSARGFLAIRACRASGGLTFADPALRAALDAALRRAARRLDRAGIPHRRLDDTELETAAAGDAREARSADPLNRDYLVRLTGLPGAETVDAWSGTDTGRPLSIPATGIVIGDDRSGRRLRIRVPASGVPVRVIVIGGPAAARTLERHAAGVPLHIDVLDHAAPADAAALRAADVVVCRLLAPKDAYAVADALDLSATTAAWLSQIDQDMVAVIADGLVRWAMMPAPVGAYPEEQGLAAFA